MNSLTVRSKRMRRRDAVDGREAQAGRARARRRADPSSSLLDRDLLLRVERDRRAARRLVDRHGRIRHAAVVGARRGEHEPPTPAAARASEATLRLPSTLTSCERSGSRAHAGSPTIAARCTTASAPSSAAARALGVAHVAADQLDAALGERGGDALLAVQQHVEDAHLVTGIEQLFDDEGPM